MLSQDYFGVKTMEYYDTITNTRTLTQKLMKLLEGAYRPSNLDEAELLRKLARLNKLYLPFLRTLRDLYHKEWSKEEKRFKKYINNIIIIIRTLKNLDYALFKFRKPLDYVPADIDILIKREHVAEALRRLNHRGFRIVVWEPYTVTLSKGEIIVDLYTQPAFAWMIYLNGRRLLEETEVVELEPQGVEARMLTREAEVIASATHAVYKEQIYLLIDYYVIKHWLNRRALALARELNAEKALEILYVISEGIEKGLVEAPVKIAPIKILGTFVKKFINDSIFRATSINVTRLLMNRGISLMVWRLRRESY